MSHLTVKNQVKVGSKIFTYRQFVSDSASSFSKSNLSARSAKVALLNDKIAVLDDAMLTRISIDSEYHHGLMQIDKPFISINVDCPMFGNGFNFTLVSSIEISADTLQEIIMNEYSKKVKPLMSVNLPAIDNQLIADALTLSNQGVL